MTTAVGGAPPRPLWVRVLRVFAALIALRAATNLFKPFGAGNAFVFLGTKLTSSAGMWLAVAVGLSMLLYATGAWNARRWALPMSIAYAVFVILNILLFPVFNDIPPGVRYQIGAIVFLVIGVGVTAGAAYLLWAHRDELT